MKTYFLLALTLSTSLTAVTDLGQSLVPPVTRPAPAPAQLQIPYVEEPTYPAHALVHQRELSFGEEDSCCVETCCSQWSPIFSCGGLCPRRLDLKVAAWSTGTIASMVALWALGVPLDQAIRIFNA